MRTNSSFSIGSLILRFRAPIGIILSLVTIFMVYASSRVQVGTRFVDFFPSYHPYILLNGKYQRSFGGAETLAIMIHVKDGDIFNPVTLKKIQGLTEAMDKLPGVNHEEVFSIGSFRANYVKAESGALITQPYMFPDVPKDEKGIAALKNNVVVHHDALSQLVSSDFKSAMVTASFNDEAINYREFFKDVQDITSKFQDENNRIYVAGEPMTRGWGYHYLPRLLAVIFISLAIIVLVHYYGIRGIARWWAPLMTGTCSALWGMGFTGIIGYQLDPVKGLVMTNMSYFTKNNSPDWQNMHKPHAQPVNGGASALVQYGYPPERVKTERFGATGGT